jgi:hypothetical protein
MELKRISDEEIDAVEQKLSEDPLEELHLNRGHIENYGDKIADAQLQADQSVVDELADELRVGGILLAKRTDQCRELELKLKELEAKHREEIQQIFDVYDRYIKILGSESDELITLVTVHGWKSTRIEQGIECRENIKLLKEKYTGEKKC